MSHFTRMKKSGEVAVRKGGYFMSGDDGSKDAGASNANPQFQPSPTSHMHSIADRHATEGGLHADVAEKLSWMGMDKQAAAHRSVANEHNVASGHYRAAAHAHMDGAVDEAGKHLKSARVSAAAAKDKNDAMMA